MRKVLGLLLLLSVVSAAWAQERQDTIVVSRDGTGNFRTLQEAIESARAFMDIERQMHTAYIETPAQGMDSPKMTGKRSAHPVAGFGV